MGAMPFNRQPGPRRSRAALLVTLLLLTLVVAGVLAAQAYVAARSHQQVAERVLNDYVSAATWEFGRLSRKEIDAALAGMLQPELCAERPPFDLGAPVDRSNPLSDHVTNYLQASLGRGTFTSLGPPLPVSIETRLLRELRLHARSLFVGTSPPLMLVFGETSPRVFAFVVQHGAPGDDTAYGFEADPEFLRQIFERVLDRGTLLPPALAPKAESAKYLSAAVMDSQGHVLYRSSAGEVSAFRHKMALDRSHGKLWVNMWLAPESAGKLIIGGLPRSRLPLLIGLVGLTVILVGVALMQLKREYDLVRLRGTFVANVSHELRTPLAQIRMFSETLLLGRIRSEQEGRRSLEIIDQEARRLAQLVENVLLFSRSERGGNRLAPERTMLGPLLADVAEAFRPLARARGAEVSIEAAEQVIAPIDRCAVKQMLLNLLDNAVKYGPAGQTIRIGMRLQDTFVRLWVQDEGPGIPDACRKDVWRPFWRMERERNSGVAGTGIGLAVVRELCELHGGEAWIENAEGGGARVVLSLPGAEPGVAERAVPAAAQVVGVRM